MFQSIKKRNNHDNYFIYHILYNSVILDFIYELSNHYLLGKGTNGQKRLYNESPTTTKGHSKGEFRYQQTKTDRCNLDRTSTPKSKNSPSLKITRKLNQTTFRVQAMI